MGFGLCVAGCGRFAKTFVKAVRSYRDLGPVGQIELFFASRDRNKAGAYCRMFDGSGYFGGYEEAAADSRVEAIYFCTPHDLHMENTLMAARFSKHILVEKPIARTLEEGERMVAAASDAGVKLMVAENYRFMPPVLKSRELIEEGVIGGPRFIQIQEESNFTVEGWRTNRRMMGGGVLIDGGIHSANMLVNLGGMPEEVYATILPPRLQGLEGEDGVVIIARLKGGATGLINHAWGISKRSWTSLVAISGTVGRISFGPGSLRLTLETAEGKNTFKFPEDPRGIGRMVKEFVASITDDRPPLTSGEEALRDLKVVLAAYESAARGVPVAVE